jgi:hypothetical protein
VNAQSRSLAMGKVACTSCQNEAVKKSRTEGDVIMDVSKMRAFFMDSYSQ